MAVAVQIRSLCKFPGISGRVTAVLAPRHRVAENSRVHINGSFVTFRPDLVVLGGSRLDRRWDTMDKTPWIALSVFTLICLAGAFLPIGYVGFLPYGFVVWLFTTFAVSRGTHTCSGIPIASPNKTVSHDWRN
jgi:hypothetical protein